MSASRDMALPSAIVLAVGVVLVTTLLAPATHDVDSTHYINTAQGRIAEVYKPFSNRLLHPLAAGALARVFSLTLETSFFLVGALALFVFVLAVLLLARPFLSPFFVVPLVTSPLLIALFHERYLPDLFHAALLGLFFLCLARGPLGAAPALLFALQLTRESTLLLSVLLVALCLLRGRWRLALGSIIAAACGLAATSAFARLGQPNIHGMNDLLYLATKVPYNFLKNVLGLTIWTNTHAASNPSSFPGAPLWVLELPDWLRAGAIHSVGIYRWDVLVPLGTAILLLATFGVLPALVLSDLAHRRGKLLRDSPFWVVLALSYGGLAFLAGTSTGASVGRLVGYGWPCFWVAGPFLLHRHHGADRAFLLRFLSCHVAASWLPFVARDAEAPSLAGSIAVLAVLLALHGCALRESTGSQREPAASATGRDPDPPAPAP